ncbi:MerR family transcriptional regulator (plasmid) [Pseudomonas mandelii]|uniref:MerR family transcriptional regulator n=1 Tax=Pseudomonas mandelii TaxID=75612 RepID=UPI00398D0135
MNIGEAASESGLSAKMIRYYERIDLIPSSQRTQAGYRVYRENDIQVLRFIHHARDLGFSVEQVRSVLALWRYRTRPDVEVEAVARSYLEALNTRIATLQVMREALSYLAEHCDDSERPPGPILDDPAPPNTYLKGEHHDLQ